jgi:phage terminase small subunit
MTPAARKHWRRLAKLLDRAGIISEVDGLSIRNRAWEQIVKLCASFGLTPADRNGMHFDFRNRGLRPSGSWDPKSRFFDDPPLRQKPDS